MSTSVVNTCESEGFGSPDVHQEAVDRFIPEGFANIVNFETNWLACEYYEKHGLDPERIRSFLCQTSQEVRNILENGYIIDSFGRLACLPQTVAGLNEDQVNGIGNRIEPHPFVTTYAKALEAGISFAEQPEKPPKNVFFLWKDKISKLFYTLTKGNGVTFECGTKVGPKLILEYGMSYIGELVSSLHFYVYDRCAQNPDLKNLKKLDQALIPSNLVAACLIDYSNNHGGGRFVDARINKEKYRGRDISGGL